MQDWQALAAKARAVPGTAGVAPFADVQAMIGRAGHLQPVLLHGLDPQLEGAVSDVEQHMVEGRLADLEPGARRIILGRVVAWQLGAALGDEITVMVPGRELLSSGGRPRLQTFTVAGVFEIGLQEHDGGLALVALEDAAALGGGAALPTGCGSSSTTSCVRRPERRRWRPRWAAAPRCATGPRSTRPTSAPSASRRP